MKKRLDVLLVEKGFFESREKAKAVIMSGCVYVNNQKADKAGTNFDENAAVEVRDNRMRYVSRGGYKLEKAMEVFPITLEGKVTMEAALPTVCSKTAHRRSTPWTSATDSSRGSSEATSASSISSAPTCAMSRMSRCPNGSTSSPWTSPLSR